MGGVFNKIYSVGCVICRSFLYFQAFVIIILVVIILICDHSSLYKDFIEHDCNIGDNWIVNNIYRYTEDFVKVFSNSLGVAPVRQIYEFLLQEVIYRNDSLIPSRNEKITKRLVYT